MSDETYIDNEGIARIRPNCVPGPDLTATSGQGPLGHKGASVGRIVHYYRMAAMVPAKEREPMAAIITRVHEGGVGMVELQVFGLGTECPIHRTVPFHPSARSGCWTWPPRV